VVVLAAGDGRRVGAGTNKVLLPLAGLPVFAWSLRTLKRMPYVDRVVVVIREQDRHAITSTLRGSVPDLAVEVVVGGITRHGSEWNALRSLAPSIDGGEIDVVAIHDAARPLADERLFRDVIDAAVVHGGALPVREQRSLISRGPAGLRGAGMVAVQTPQAFTATVLLDAYRRADRDGFTGTDTASCVAEYTNVAIRCVPSPATNLKVTFAEDVAVAEHLLARQGGRTDHD
jgi:2-C-methyl-D-erythritol 4-phosphate cytidylyltransferase